MSFYLHVWVFNHARWLWVSWKVPLNKMILIIINYQPLHTEWRLENVYWHRSRGTAALCTKLSHQFLNSHLWKPQTSIYSPVKKKSRYKNILQISSIYKDSFFSTRRSTVTGQLVFSLAALPKTSNSSSYMSLNLAPKLRTPQGTQEVAGKPPLEVDASRGSQKNILREKSVSDFCSGAFNSR